MTNSPQPSKSFWIISVLALLWNAMGVMAFVMMRRITTEQLVEQYGQGFADLFATKPAWAVGSFAVAVFAGLIASIALLLRKKLALPLFVVSLVGVIIHDIWGIMVGTLSVIGTFDKVMTLAVVVIGVFLIWFSKKKIAAGILR